MTKQEALRIVVKLGFVARNGKELFYKYVYDGRLITTTAIPKGKGTLHIENDFRQQLRVNREQLALARKCPFGAAEYRRHLVDIGLIEEDESEE
jgi:hypothetical protein